MQDEEDSTQYRPVPAASEVCKVCRSDHQEQFLGKIAIHPGENPNDPAKKPTLWVFPKLSICLDCGYAEICFFEFTPHDEGKALGPRSARNAGSSG